MEKKGLQRDRKVLKINDPIHGFVLFPYKLAKIIDSKEIQRLMRIRQLSGTNHVFPGANHTRFEHSLGVAALAQRLMVTLRDIKEIDLSQEDIEDGVVAALCHDIGHGPFSHNFEGLLLRETGKDHEDYGEWIITHSELADTLSDLGFDPKYISNISTGKIIGQGNAKGTLLSQAITSAVNVDSMDYLLRDNYHCGTHGRSIDVDRLLLSMDYLEDGYLGIDINALIALEGFLLARISSFRTIYFHKTCRAVQLMLAEAMEKAAPEIGLLDYATPDDYVRWDDYTLWSELIKNPQSLPIMHKLQNRQLLKMCYESRIEITNLNIDPHNIRNVLAAEAHLSPNDIYVDLPSSPNVPYNHISETRPNDTYTFRYANGRKERVPLETYSLFFEQFKGKLKLIRVYTWPQYRQTLANAAQVVLGSVNLTNP